MSKLSAQTKVVYGDNQFVHLSMYLDLPTEVISTDQEPGESGKVRRIDD